MTTVLCFLGVIVMYFIGKWVDDNEDVAMPFIRSMITVPFVVTLWLLSMGTSAAALYGFYLIIVRIF